MIPPADGEECRGMNIAGYELEAAVAVPRFLRKDRDKHGT